MGLMSEEVTEKQYLFIYLMAFGVPATPMSVFDLKNEGGAFSLVLSLA